jgi:hypothetical protein
MGSPIAKPAVLAQSNVARNLLIILASVIVLALVGVGGWFGYSKISIHHQRGPLPSGLVALWSGEGNGKDSVNGHDAIVSGGMTYSPAKVGSGFNFAAPSCTVSVPASPAIDVGSGQGFTLGCWIAPAASDTSEPLLEWGGNQRGINQGTHIWISDNWGGIGGPGCIYAAIIDINGKQSDFASPPGLVQAGILQYVAVTYDKASGLGKIYFNGSLVATSNLGSLTPKTDTTLFIGQRAEYGDFHFIGTMDEIAIFNRALSAEEIQAIYTAQK